MLVHESIIYGWKSFKNLQDPTVPRGGWNFWILLATPVLLQVHCHWRMDLLIHLEKTLCDSLRRHRAGTKKLPQERNVLTLFKLLSPAAFIYLLCTSSCLYENVFASSRPLQVSEAPGVVGQKDHHSGMRIFSQSCLKKCHLRRFIAVRST